MEGTGEMSGMLIGGKGWKISGVITGRDGEEMGWDTNIGKGVGKGVRY